MSLDEVIFTISGQEFTLGQLVIIPAVLIVGYLAIHWLARMITNRLVALEMEPDVIHLIRRIFFIVGLLVLAITALDLLNVPLTAFAFVSGAIAIGVGFGAQNIINNFISGWILMWERPIRIGDYLEVGGSTGTVESIDTRSTRIRRPDGVHMLVPNSALLENTVVNWTLIDYLTRTVVRVGVAYGSPVKQVAELIKQATTEQEAVLAEPVPSVVFEDFGDSALIFDVYFWVNATAERNLRVIRSDIRFRISELFDANEIVIAYPQQDVHIDGNIKLINPSQKDR